jgi:hypothetical protein
MAPASPVSASLRLLLVATLSAASIARTLQKNRKPQAATFTLLPGAPQAVYTTGVPHTDRVGQRRFSYSAEESFFPLILYHSVLTGEAGVNFSASQYVDAGFNTLHYWEGYQLADALSLARQHRLQLIPYVGTGNATDIALNTVRPHATDPNILGWFLAEEPTSDSTGNGCAPPVNKSCDGYQEFLATRKAIKAVDSLHCLFNIDSAWTSNPWWPVWNTDADDENKQHVSCHDNYPWGGSVGSSAAFGGAFGSLDRFQGIPDTVSLAVTANKENAPVWLCIQAFEQPTDGQFWWSMPSPRQLRVQAYAAVIHGATGIIYFALDSWVTRIGAAIGMSWETSFSEADSMLRNTGQGGFNASKALASESRLAWAAATQLNTELTSLSSALLSSTSNASYDVFFQGSNMSPTPLRTILKEDPVRKALLLICVNLDATPLVGKFEFDPSANIGAPHAPPAGDGVAVLFEGLAGERSEAELRRVDVVRDPAPGKVDWSFIDAFEPFEAHVYVLAV